MYKIFGPHCNGKTGPGIDIALIDRPLEQEWTKLKQLRGIEKWECARGVQQVLPGIIYSCILSEEAMSSFCEKDSDFLRKNHVKHHLLDVSFAGWDPPSIDRFLLEQLLTLKRSSCLFDIRPS